MCLVSTFFMQTAFALDSVSATVDKNPAVVNESIILNVIADDDVDRTALDTAPLLKDFIVGRVSVSSQTSMINFDTTRTTQWQIILIPRKSGSITIPSLTIEGKSTAPIALTVLSASSNQAQQQKDIFITSEVSTKQLYVQQLLTLTVKLHFNAELKRASLTAPTLPGATIEQIGKDNETDGIVNGKRYRIVERKYAITPQQSGDFTLVAPMFSGEIMVQSRRRSNFLSFGETKPVSVLGEEINISVLPIPDSYPTQAQWLPSEIITLHQEWQPDIADFKVGEPITRTILLTGAGLSKEQLPKIAMEAPQGIKIYPDQAELNSTMAQDRLVSQLRQNFALVASRPGSYQLPEIKVSWWNTVTNRYQEATLPAQEISVSANNDFKETNPPVQSTPAASQQTSDLSTAQTADTHSSQTHATLIENSNWQWLFLGLWLVTLLAWFLHVQRLKRYLPLQEHSKANVHKSIKSNQQYYLALLAACKSNDAQQAINLLLPWLNSAEGQHQEITTFEQAIDQINSSDFSIALQALQQYLYGKTNEENHAQPWQGNLLLLAIQAINKQHKAPNAAVAMQLNP